MTIAFLIVFVGTCGWIVGYTFGVRLERERLLPRIEAMTDRITALTEKVNKL